MTEPVNRVRSAPSKRSRRRTPAARDELLMLPPASLIGSEITELLLTIDEVAELVGVSGKTVRRWITSGRIVARKLGGQWRIHPSDYRAFLHAGVTE